MSRYHTSPFNIIALFSYLPLLTHLNLGTWLLSICVWFNTAHLLYFIVSSVLFSGVLLLWLMFAVVTINGSLLVESYSSGSGGNSATTSCNYHLTINNVGLLLTDASLKALETLLLQVFPTLKYVLIHRQSSDTLVLLLCFNTSITLSCLIATLSLYLVAYKSNLSLTPINSLEGFLIWLLSKLTDQDILHLVSGTSSLNFSVSCTFSTLFGGTVMYSILPYSSLDTWIVSMGYTNVTQPANSSWVASRRIRSACPSINW